MSPSHVIEVSAAMHAPRAPRGFRARGHAFGRELLRQCDAQVRDGEKLSPADERRLDDLLASAVTFLRDAVARELGLARRRAGLSRVEVARRSGRTPSYVARAERGQAAFDVEFMTSVRALRKDS
jgi:ribosome-binding protein aMBF1 (putative translation factor)